MRQQTELMEDRQDGGQDDDGDMAWDLGLLASPSRDANERLVLLHVRPRLRDSRAQPQGCGGQRRVQLRRRRRRPSRIDDSSRIVSADQGRRLTLKVNAPCDAVRPVWQPYAVCTVQ